MADVWMYAALGGVGLAAGFVDAIAGGGGLLTTPALLHYIPLGQNPLSILATNKGQSVFGSGMALLRFARSPLLDQRRCVVAFVPGLAGAALGVFTVSLIDRDKVRPLVMALLVAVAILMMFYRVPHSRPPLKRSRLWAAVPIAFVIAFYDGFFGPGTGTFLILAYALVFHDPLDAASANAKLVNFASNLSSLAIFAARGLVIWKMALPMAAGQAIGSFAGAHVTIQKGRGVVRLAVIIISLALVMSLAWQLWHG
jgi:hypothetical protein